MVHVSSVAIRDFQSLRKVDLELGKFTVIVGQSSAGKSAFLRSMRTIAANTRGSAFLSHGASKTTITTVTDQGAVTLTKGSGSASYVLQQGDTEKPYTKLAGTVPADVATTLGFTEDDIAGQFDQPYLLDASGAAVARVLGELTNVSVIFEAVREANRRKAEATQKLKTRQDDLLRIREQAKKFLGLKEQVAALTQAETLNEQAQSISDKATRLKALVLDLETAESVLARVPKIIDVPDFTEIQLLQERRDLFASLLTQLQTAATQKAASEVTLADTAIQLDIAEKALHTYLVDVGECPMCGQSTKELESVS